MSFDFASLKATTRRVVQDTLGVSATYQDDSMDEPVSVCVRYKNKVKRMGELNDGGYAEVIEGIDQIVLIPSDYPEVTFKRGGTITITQYDATYVLDFAEPTNGPLTQVWHVARQ